MKEEDLKKVCIDLFSRQSKVENMLCIVDNGEAITSVGGGVNNDSIITMLAEVMIEVPLVREFFEKAYLTISTHTQSLN